MPLVNWNFAFGALATVSILLPFLGRIGGVPSLLPALLLSGIAAVLGIWIVAGAPRRNVSWVQMAPIGLASAFAAIVCISATPEQWQFLSNPALWIRRDQFYVESKLLAFVLYTTPGVFLSGCFLMMREKKPAIKGIYGVCVIFGVIASIRIISNFSTLSQYDYEIVREYIIVQGSRPYSLIAYSALMVIASASAIAVKRFWPLVAVFLFATFWVNKRAETLLIIGIVLAYYAYIIVRSKRERLAGAMKPIIIIGLAAVAAAALHNEANSMYWAALMGRSVQERVDIAKVALSENPAPKSTIDRSQIGLSTPAGAKQAEGKRPTGAHLWGSGLASFSDASPEFHYPHNILLEAYFEQGVIGAVLLSGFMVTALSLSSWTAMRGYDPFGLGLTAIAVALLGISLKSGDITLFGRLAFFMILAASLPNPVSAAAEAGPEKRSGNSLSSSTRSSALRYALLRRNR